MCLYSIKISLDSRVPDLYMTMFKVWVVYNTNKESLMKMCRRDLQFVNAVKGRANIRGGIE